jgi:hypothetical protein
VAASDVGYLGAGFQLSFRGNETRALTQLVKVTGAERPAICIADRIVY